MTTRQFELILVDKPAGWPSTAGMLIIRKAEHLPLAYQGNYGDEVKYLELVLRGKVRNANSLTRALQNGPASPIKLELELDGPGGGGERKVSELQILLLQEASRADVAEQQAAGLSRELKDARDRVLAAEAGHQALEELQNENGRLQRRHQEMVNEQLQFKQMIEGLNSQLQSERDSNQCLREEIAALRREASAGKK